MLGNRSDITHGIKARHLQVPITDALWFEPGVRAEDAWRQLDANHFDNAPVLQDGRTLGVVNRERLVEPSVQTVGDVLEPLGSDLLISADATVADLLGWLAGTQLLFVVDGHEITGFVTPGDLNKHPGRTYFFLLLAELEIGLAEIVRRLYRGAPSRPLELLAKGRRDKVFGLYSKAVAADREPDFVAYFNLADLLRVMQRSPEANLLLGIESGSAWVKITGAFVQVRDAVVHGVRDLVDADRGPLELQAIDTRLRMALDLTETGLVRLGLRHQHEGSDADDISPALGWALAGVDGCRAGWIAAVQEASGEVRLELVESTPALLDLDVALIAIDMPIGLNETAVGGRPVDRLARAHLGARRSSVFSAPPRQAFVVDSWDHARRPEFGLTRQALGILRKVQELDAAVAPERQWRGTPQPGALIAEVHPEVSFAQLNDGMPMATGKRTRLGRARRADLLRRDFPEVDRLVATRPSGVHPDDVLDALVALWTARRMVMGTSSRIGGDVDLRGLGMVIWS